MIGHQDCSPSNGHQGDMPYCTVHFVLSNKNSCLPPIPIAAWLCWHSSTRQTVLCWQKPGTFSQTIYELITEISCKKFFCFNHDSHNPVRSQICTCHDSWAVVACAKLWPDLIIIFHVRDSNCGNIWIICSLTLYEILHCSLGNCLAVYILYMAIGRQTLLVMKITGLCLSVY